ncbi:MAG: hypothetical protein C0469_16230 [Cyanobacteria bacterium DS2.3.42]|nr:hypothetical protein [Cyanobacteria bacterium DS2.3.42]
MDQFHKYDPAQMLGPSPLAKATDELVLTHMVSPQIKAFLGQQIGGRVELRDNQAGFFPGDEVSNINGNIIKGRNGEALVRFPYVSSLYEHKNGCLIIKRDFAKIKVFAWLGDYKNGKAELILSTALRDRRYDGTKQANDCSLLDYPYDDPVLSKRLTVDGSTADLVTAETSLYSYIPGSTIAKSGGGKQLDQFIAKPFAFMNRPKLFLRLFKRAWKLDRFPGQNSIPVPDVGKLAHAGWEAVAKACGLDALETCPSHYHVTLWNMAKGYHFSYAEQEANINAYKAGIQKLKDNGVQLTRPQEAWVCVLNSLEPKELIPEHLRMDVPKWIQTCLDQESIWLVKPLSEKAVKLLKK